MCCYRAVSKEFKQKTFEFGKIDGYPKNPHESDPDNDYGAASASKFDPDSD